MSFFRRFGKDPKELFLEFNPTASHWRIVTWNFDLSSPATRRWTVEARGEETRVIIWEQNKVQELNFYKDSKLLRKKRMISSENELRSLMNLSIHSTLKFGLEANHDFMLTPVPGATTIDMQNEARALEWIEVSFETLNKALENFQQNQQLILTGACFSGTVPESGEEVLRLIAFNLDIFYYLREDGSLQLVVFDDKNLGHGQSKEPTFQQIIKVTKPQFYDQITRLLHHMAQVGEIR